MLQINVNLLKMMSIIFPNYNLDLQKLEKLSILSQYNKSLIQELLESWERELENASLFNTENYINTIFPNKWFNFVIETIEFLGRAREFNILFLILHKIFEND